MSPSENFLKDALISLAVWIQYMNVTDGWTDGRTDTGWQQRPRYTSRGKNVQLRYHRQFLWFMVIYIR